MVEQAEVLEHHADPAAQAGSSRGGMRAVSRPNRLISPRVGFSERNRRRSNEVLPAPDGPVRNWKVCGATSKVRSLSTSGPMP